MTERSRTPGMEEVENALKDLCTRWSSTEGEAREDLIVSIHQSLSWQARAVWMAVIEDLSGRKLLDEHYLSEFCATLRSRVQCAALAVFTCHVDVTQVRADVERFSGELLGPTLEGELLGVERLLLDSGSVVRVEWLQPLVPGSKPWVSILCTWRVSWGLYTGVTRIRLSLSRHDGQQMVTLDFPGFGRQLSVTLDARVIATLILSFDPGVAMRTLREVPEDAVVLSPRASQ